MVKISYLQIPDGVSGMIIRKAVRKTNSKLILEEFVLEYYSYYRNAGRSPRVTGNLLQFKEWLREIKNGGGSGFFHTSCIDEAIFACIITVSGIKKNMRLYTITD